MTSRHTSVRRSLCAALAGLVLAALALIPSLHAVGASRRANPGLSTNYDFARLVLEDGGWPTSTSNVTVLAQWLRAEEPVSHWWDRDNPLNNGLGDGGGSGLGSYDSLLTAAYEVAQNLQSSYAGYPLVARDLAHSAAAGVTARAIWRSDWAAGHYGFGADWDTAPVASVPAPPSAWRDLSSCGRTRADGVVAPCGRGFSATGPSWHWNSLGSQGEQLWAVAGRRSAPSEVTWAAAVPAGPYEVDAYVPASFADALATYVVVDARGGHRVVLNQEPYDDAWVPLGTFEAAPSTPLRVVLDTATSGSAPGTYLSAASMRFTRVATRARSGRAPLRATIPLERPGRPLDVTAVPASSSARVSWLAPSKDGGDVIASYVATSLSGGHTCRVVARSGQEPSCTVRGLANGVAYQFEVRAQSHAGVSRPSAPSAAVLPEQPTTLTVTTMGTAQYGHDVVFRVTLRPSSSGGLVLFALDGKVLPRCQSERVVRGHASCTARTWTVGRGQLVLATYSGTSGTSGSEAFSTVHVGRAPTALHAAVAPSSAEQLRVVTARAWGLPRDAAGQIVFTSSGHRLCAIGVRNGAGSCSFRVHLGVGDHDVEAHYLGSRDYLDAVADTSLRVLAPPPPPPSTTTTTTTTTTTIP